MSLYIPQIPRAALLILGRGHGWSGGRAVLWLSVLGWVCYSKHCGAVMPVNQAADPRAASRSSSIILIAAAAAGEVPVRPRCDGEQQQRQLQHFVSS